MTPAEMVESVRKRPGMYFGSTQAYGAFTWLTYVLSDAIAEYEAGHSTFLYLRLVHGGRFEIIDDGRPLRSRGWKVSSTALPRTRTSTGPQRPAPPPTTAARSAPTA